MSTLPTLDKDAYNKIFGSKDLSSEENILLFRTTQNFILNSDRFSGHNKIGDIKWELRCFLFLAPAVTVGETEGAMDSTSVFFGLFFCL